MSEDELPEISELLPHSRNNGMNRVSSIRLRRSPRKQNNPSATAQVNFSIPEDRLQLTASSQQRMSPQKQTSSRTALKPTQPKTHQIVLKDIPDLAITSREAVQRNRIKPISLVDDDSEDDLAGPFQHVSFGTKARYQTKAHQCDSEEKEETLSRKKSMGVTPTSTMSRITRAAKRPAGGTERGGANITLNSERLQGSNSYVLTEARCEDLNDSSGVEEEDEDTDLSGFIVADDADLSFHESPQAVSSGEDKNRRRNKDNKHTKPGIGRRLVRGRRRRLTDSDDDDDPGLAKALNALKIGEQLLEKQKNTDRTKNIEIIDLTSSPVPEQVTREYYGVVESVPDEAEDSSTRSASALIPSFHSIPILQPKYATHLKLPPSKAGPSPSRPQRPTKQAATERSATPPATPPVTPPRSPSKTKLKSPTKLLSPSKKHNADVPRSPHRQSMDSFWDLHTINEWHDTYSPKKAPISSPRKNPVARFSSRMSDGPEDTSNIGDSIPSSRTNDSQDRFDESTGSLPSPTTSPSKSRSPTKISALKAEQARIREEKRAKATAKKTFDATKETLALDLLVALDKYTTDSKIGNMAASTGGIKIVWSKTLRSTAGRANWKRTVSKASGSPVKENLNNRTQEKQLGLTIQHFASIELAEKIIDRPERLVNTLAHEFCHLANFMVSGVRDQPHGDSFKRWGLKVTNWLKSSAAKGVDGWREEWNLAEVTTKHSYVIETKYLWMCTGRPVEKQKPSLAMKMLNIEYEDEEGCGAEYGRHSKSIDIEKQRCGRCKGFLVQVRPAPRASSPKKSPMKRIGIKDMNDESNDVNGLENLMGSVDLSD